MLDAGPGWVRERLKIRPDFLQPTVVHGGIIYTLEGHLGAEFAPIKNLHGRWLRMNSTHVELGDRVALVTDSADKAADI